ncbi:MAG: LAS superfamily LD-carboxypeptidase LdcB [Flavobacteriales bacterium]|jgi:LAS superfamily LD-carboxypeptidase LdcB
MKKTQILIGLMLMIFLPSVVGQIVLPENELLGQGSPNLIEKDGYRLRTKAADAFEALKAAALKDGIVIKVVSSYRDYAHQNRIWERKYLRFRESGLSPILSIQKIIEYSTIPGTSRHHWGTDLDLIDGTPKVDGDVLVPSKFHGTGPFCKFKDWMDIHANSYGFQLVYTDAIHRKGFKYEPWHYSYAPLSKGYLKAYNALDIQQKLTEAKLMGSKNFTLAFIQKYLEENVNDINPTLLD